MLACNMRSIASLSNVCRGQAAAECHWLQATLCDCRWHQAAMLTAAQMKLGGRKQGGHRPHGDPPRLALTGQAAFRACIHDLKSWRSKRVTWVMVVPSALPTPWIRQVVRYCCVVCTLGPAFVNISFCITHISSLN